MAGLLKTRSDMSVSVKSSRCLGNASELLVLTAFLFLKLFDQCFGVEALARLMPDWRSGRGSVLGN